MNNLLSKALLLATVLLSGMTAFAQEAGDTTSVYQYAPAKHEWVQYIGPAILLIIIVYVGYRYWRDNRHDNGVKHQPHHQ